MFRETLPPDLLERADELRALDVPLPEDGKISISVAFHLARLRRFLVQSRIKRTRQLLDELPAEDVLAATASLTNLMQEKRSVDEDLDRLSRLVPKSISAGLDQGTIVQDSGRL
jgi:hypothetical protein